MNQLLKKLLDAIEPVSGAFPVRFATASALLQEADREMEILDSTLKGTIQDKETAQVLLDRIKAELEQKRISTEEISRALEQALTDLKATQEQLIHSEKMASLGELTAGIAHEIQNPLNFVNNFSEVSSELLMDLKEEIEQGRMAEVNEIIDDLLGNLKKVHHHGKRASSIVKGMLDHSRASSDQKISTNISELCDEYLRLAYHGLRAKDHSFNADYVTFFDEDLPNVLVIPQDFGRVMLNLINNAFYAVGQKKKTELITQGEKTGSYEPKVTVSTKRKDKNVLITVADNGNGMSKEVINNIFQPFYTTKPTGEGTGLGLSISYEIITKDHGGRLEVKSVENEGSIFTITLPL